MGSIVMRLEKQKATELRKKGLSYAQIGKILNVSKSTLSYWLSGIVLPKDAQDILDKRSYKKSTEALIKRNKNQTKLAAERANKIRIAAKKEFRSLIKRPLFLSGISLYWAEGYKKGAAGSRWKSVDFANSDPEMIVIMMKFFLEECDIPLEKVRAQLIAHENVEIRSAVNYWARITKIHKNRFIKTCISDKRKRISKRKNSNLTHGTLHIRINDVSFFFKIIGWIDGLKEYFEGP
jgi:predicted transcriptional regulator